MGVLGASWGVLGCLGSILEGWWGRLRARVKRGFDVLDRIEGSSKLFRVWDQFLIDF